MTVEAIFTDTQTKILRVLFNRTVVKKGAMQGKKLKDEIGLKDDSPDLTENLRRKDEFLSALRGLIEKNVVSCTDGDQLKREYKMFEDFYYIVPAKKEVIGMILKPTKII